MESMDLVRVVSFDVIKGMCTRIALNVVLARK